MHEEAVKTVEAIKTVSSAPWWARAAATEDALLLMQRPANLVAGALRIPGTNPAKPWCKLRKSTSALPLQESFTTNTRILSET